jgi:hypothetical protein
VTVRHLIPLTAIALAACLALPAAAPAPIAPRDCGDMRMRGKTYQVKADVISCKTAREHVKRRFTRGTKPRGYTCRRQAPGSRVKVYCNNGKKLFMAIDRGRR